MTELSLLIYTVIQFNAIDTILLRRRSVISYNKANPVSKYLKKNTESFTFHVSDIVNADDLPDANCRARDVWYDVISESTDHVLVDVHWNNTFFRLFVTFICILFVFFRHIHGAVHFLIFPFS